MTPEALRRVLPDLPETASLTLTVAELRGLVQCESAIATEARPVDETETWLTADEVAAMLNTSARWVYDHGTELGAKRLSRRCVRFSARAVTRRMTRR